MRIWRESKKIGGGGVLVAVVAVVVIIGGGGGVAKREGCREPGRYENRRLRGITHPLERVLRSDCCTAGKEGTTPRENQGREKKERNIGKK